MTPRDARRRTGLPRAVVTAGARRAVALALSVSLGAARAGAQTAGDTDELRWKWPVFRPVEYVATGALAVSSLGLFFLNSPREKPRFVGGVLFDDAVRGALRLRTANARDAARSWSDVTALGAVFLALGVDSALTPIARGSPSVAYQMLLLDVEAYALSSLITTATFDAVGRARPTYASCRADPKFDPLCHSGPTASFYSGHTAQAFTAAGLSCAHHQYVDLWGGGVADALGCAGAAGLAAATAVLRVTGDRHYATDVLAGALVGFAVGYGVPTLLHYRSPEERAATDGASLGSALSQGFRFTASGTF